MNPAWCTAESAPPLAAGEVHVWRVAAGAGGRDAASALLSAEERRRAAAFRAAADRERFVAARATLRRLLGEYSACRPEEIRFGLGSAGKPFVAAPARARPIRFNASHSGDFVLLAFAGGVEVGVDVEHCRREIDVVDLADRFFSPGESDEVRRASGDERIGLFYTCWTRKEACLKAIGEGLRTELRSFAAGCVDDCRVVSMASPLLAPPRRVRLRSVPFADDYRAALASEGDADLRPVFLSPPPGA